MKDKLPDYVLEKCKIYINGHVIIIRFIKCRERPFYTVYYSVDKRFKGKSNN